MSILFSLAPGNKILVALYTEIFTIHNGRPEKTNSGMFKVFSYPKNMFILSHWNSVLQVTGLVDEELSINVLM